MKKKLLLFFVLGLFSQSVYAIEFGGALFSPHVEDYTLTEDGNSIITTINTAFSLGDQAVLYVLYNETQCGVGTQEHDQTVCDVPCEQAGATITCSINYDFGAYGSGRLLAEGETFSIRADRITIDQFGDTEIQSREYRYLASSPLLTMAALQAAVADDDTADDGEGEDACPEGTAYFPDEDVCLRIATNPPPGSGVGAPPPGTGGGNMAESGQGDGMCQLQLNAKPQNGNILGILLLLGLLGLKLRSHQKGV